MIKIIAGEKGQGKTRKLIALANDHLQVTEGHIVFIEEGNRNIHEIHRNIRLVDTSEYPILNYREFVTCVYGMLSQNSDISEIFIDSLSKVIRGISMDDMALLVAALQRIGTDWDVDFYFTINCAPDELPAEVRALTE